jgi:hypothetical protein
MKSLEYDGTSPARHADAVGDLGHRADIGELLLVIGGEQDAVLIADVDRQRERHAREDDCVVQRDEKEAC